jgi:hypothetical protein
LIVTVPPAVTATVDPVATGAYPTEAFAATAEPTAHGYTPECAVTFSHGVRELYVVPLNATVHTVPFPIPFAWNVTVPRGEERFTSANARTGVGCAGTTTTFVPPSTQPKYSHPDWLDVAVMSETV